MRSFGAKQAISFARADGRPAQWAIILGDNGVGKTMVLKALAALMPWSENRLDSDVSRAPRFDRIVNSWWPIRNIGEKTLTIDYTAHVGLFDKPNSYHNMADMNPATMSPTDLAREVAKCGSIPALVKRILQARTIRTAAALDAAGFTGMVRANFPHLPTS